MNWEKYQEEIYNYLLETYPKANIKYNQKIKGRYSKTVRQIDILVEATIVGKKIRLIFDGKYFSKKINVKDIEAFISMIEDVNASQGVMITAKGYSKAALNRAYYGPTSVELDILNFNELKQFQGSGGMPYAGKYGVLIPSPFGWIIDGTNREGFLASFYQRGLSFEEAVKSNEWMYLKISAKVGDLSTLEELIEHQEKVTKHLTPDAKFNYDESIKREDERKTLLRKISIKSYPTDEYTGFVVFDEFIVFIVLFTPKEVKEKNIRKLEYLLERIIPLNVNEESFLKSKLSKLEYLLGNTSDIIEKAEICIDQGDINKKLNRIEDSFNKYKDSLKYYDKSYGAIKGIIDLNLLQNNNIEDFSKELDRIFKLGPENPTVCQDLMDVFFEHNRVDDLIEVFKGKIKQFNKNDSALGNLYYHLGMINLDLDKDSESKKYLLLANEKFEKVFDPDHYVFNLVEESLKHLKSKERKKIKSKLNNYP